MKHKIQFGCEADELAKKVASGLKTATSSLYDYYRLNLKKQMKAGDYAAILDSSGNEKCIIKIVRVEIIPFKNITETFAIAEGDGNLENWLNIHTKYYSSLLAKIGKELTGDTELLCEWFKVVSFQEIAE